MFRLVLFRSYPAVDVLESVSRLTRDLTATKQQEIAGRARNLLSVLRKNQDLINIGAYVAGSNPEIDRALTLQKPLRDILRTGIGEGIQDAKSWDSSGKEWGRDSGGHDG